MSTTDDKSGPPIGSELRERAIRRSRNIQRWMEGQGAKIKAARPQAVYAACLLMALERCGRSDWKLLSAEQIDICEQRALSQARVRMFGPKLPPTNEDWDSQIAQVRAAWMVPTEKAA